MLKAGSPLAMFGLLVIAAELPWMRDMQRKYHDKATQEKVKIVHTSGFDSIPSDIGTLFVADHMLNQMGR